jgi:hypothetical protein
MSDALASGTGWSVFSHTSAEPVRRRQQLIYSKDHTYHNPIPNPPVGRTVARMTPGSRSQ